MEAAALLVHPWRRISFITYGFRKNVCTLIVTYLAYSVAINVLVFEVTLCFSVSVTDMQSLSLRISCIIDKCAQIL